MSNSTAALVAVSEQKGNPRIAIHYLFLQRDECGLQEISGFCDTTEIQMNVRTRDVKQVKQALLCLFLSFSLWFAILRSRSVFLGFCSAKIRNHALGERDLSSLGNESVSLCRCPMCVSKEVEKHVGNKSLYQRGLLPLAGLSFPGLINVSGNLPSDVHFY